MNKNIVWIESNCDNYYRLISKVEALSIKIYEATEQMILYSSAFLLFFAF